MILQNAESGGKTPSRADLRTPSGAVDPENTNFATLQTDARLARLVAAWPSLSEATRAQILALVESAHVDDANRKPEASR